MNHTASTLLIGIGATAITDVWGFARKPLLGAAPPDYGLVGRWIGRMARPGNARLHTLLMHAVFGVGLFVSAWALRASSV